MPKRELHRRDFLKGLSAAAVVAPALMRRATAAAISNRKPNVLMMVADDQRFDTFAALGNEHIATPNLDRLIHDGFTFTQARCMGSQQGAVCVPSRAMLHTGRTLFRVPDNCAGFALLGEVLQHEGYNAFGCGKWHNGPQSFSRAFNSGDNIFFGGMHDQYSTPVHSYSAQGKYPAKGARVGKKFSSELFADAAVDFLDHQKSAEKPFFCYLAFTSPHDPRTPPAPYKTMYDPKSMPLPANFLPEHPFDNGELRIRDEMLAPFPRTPDDTRKQLCDYYGMVSSQDAQVGRILAALEATGQADNTIIVYTGDHGLAIGSHGLFGKQNVYEHSARIPMILTGPGIPHAERSDALAYGFDIFPTLCQLLQIRPPETIEGKSLGSILSGRESRVRESSFHTYIHRGKGTQHAVNDTRWKHIRYDVKDQTHEQLFDLKNDPQEIHDLSKDPAAAAELPRMQKLLKQWRTDLAEPV
jgi:arylsulfatase A-like enzyme